MSKTYQNDKRRRNAARNRIWGQAAEQNLTIKPLTMSFKSAYERTDIDETAASWRNKYLPIRINPQPCDQHNHLSQVATRVDIK